jgi:hypothetical protein
MSFLVLVLDTTDQPNEHGTVYAAWYCTVRITSSQNYTARSFCHPSLWVCSRSLVIQGVTKLIVSFERSRSLLSIPVRLFPHFHSKTGLEGYSDPIITFETLNESIQVSINENQARSKCFIARFRSKQQTCNILDQAMIEAASLVCLM